MFLQMRLSDGNSMSSLMLDLQWTYQRHLAFLTDEGIFIASTKLWIIKVQVGMLKLLKLTNCDKVQGVLY